TEPEPIQPEPTEPEPIAIPFLPFMPDPIVETQNTLGNNDYTTWGTWTISQGNEILDYNHWISGDTTASDDLPGTGTVTYNGSVHGSVYDAGYREIDGTSSVTANFSDNTMSGTLHMKYQDSGSSFVQAHLNDTTITRASSSFSGELVNGATITDGTISGKFYGPNAEEIGGDWELTKDGNRATGIFNGKQ
ncbi:MAG: transferrin-binding protein-like solute binding protein, partial [Campylobacterota bacterium]|nr:transferrin-binding protein-like solute binding protein [Campylobacterota bacterium]